jgi:cold shock CspA family protein
MAERFTGVVKYYDAERAFGFAERDDGHGDVFLSGRHIKPWIIKTFRKGVRISFAVKPKEAKTCDIAVNVTIAEDAPGAAENPNSGTPYAER